MGGSRFQRAATGESVASIANITGQVKRLVEDEPGRFRASGDGLGWDGHRQLSGQANIGPNLDSTTGFGA